MKIILFILLILPPQIGLADNGDFVRVMGAFGIASQYCAWDLRYFDFAQFQFDILEPNRFFSGMLLVSSHLFAIAITKVLNMLFFSQEIFDIRFLSILYCITFLVSIFFITKALQTKGKCPVIDLILAFFFIFVASDARNIVYFNSFYSEPFAFVCFFAAVAFVVWVIKEDTSPRMKKVCWIGFTFFIVAFLTAKPQYTVTSIPLSASILTYCLLTQRKIKRWALMTCAFLLFSSVFAFLITPSSIASHTLFNSVFNGMLRDVDDASERLKAMGLDDRFLPFVNQQIYFVWDTEGFDELQAEFEKQVSRRTVLVHYATNPSEFIRRMENTAAVMFDNIGASASLLGNFHYSQNPEPRVQNTLFTGYSQAKALLPHTLFFIIPFYALYVFILVLTYRKSKEYRSIIWILFTIALMGVTQFPLPVLANGETDIGKQLFFFNLTFDISLAGFLSITLHHLYLRFFSCFHR